VAAVRPSSAWLGRVVNAMGEPIDGRGPVPPGPELYLFRKAPPHRPRAGHGHHAANFASHGNRKI